MPEKLNKKVCKISLTIIECVVMVKKFKTWQMVLYFIVSRTFVTKVIKEEKHLISWVRVADILIIWVIIWRASFVFHSSNDLGGITAKLAISAGIDLE